MIHSGCMSHLLQKSSSVPYLRKVAATGANNLDLVNLCLPVWSSRAYFLINADVVENPGKARIVDNRSSDMCCYSRRCLWVKTFDHMPLPLIWRRESQPGDSDPLFWGTLSIMLYKQMWLIMRNLRWCVEPQKTVVISNRMRLCQKDNAMTHLVIRIYNLFPTPPNWCIQERLAICHKTRVC